MEKMRFFGRFGPARSQGGLLLRPRYLILPRAYSFVAPTLDDVLKLFIRLLVVDFDVRRTLEAIFSVDSLLPSSWLSLSLPDICFVGLGLSHMSSLV